MSSQRAEDLRNMADAQGWAYVVLTREHAEASLERELGDAEWDAIRNTSTWRDLQATLGLAGTLDSVIREAADEASVTP